MRLPVPLQFCRSSFLETGKVLDVEVLSKYCQVCAAHRDMDKSSYEFLDWWEEHQASCEVNY